jgi:transcriptional antiterminator
MLDNLIFEWRMLVFPVVAVLYFHLLRYFDHLYYARKPATTEEYLAWLARLSERSEYDLFFISAEDWNVSEQTIEEDFKNYLRDGFIPYYVADFVRKAKKKLAPD